MLLQFCHSVHEIKLKTTSVLCFPATQCLFDENSVSFIRWKEGFLLMLNPSGDFPPSFIQRKYFTIKIAIGQLHFASWKFFFPSNSKSCFLPIFHVWIFIMNFPKNIFIYCHMTTFTHLGNQNHYQILVNCSVSLT